EWEGAMEHFFRLHRLSQVEKAEFMTPEKEGFFRDVGRAFFEEGSLRVTWLEVKGEPIASALSFVYGDTWGLYNSGYDPRYREFSPGIVLVARTIQRAMDEGLKVYDFLRGRERYKYDLGGRDRDLYFLKLSPRSDGEGR
ncbi:MAG: GNAT family N-acetyltransferase, partial [Thermodesulfobacteriota bacterium]